jgi:antitoxin HicB
VTSLASHSGNELLEASPRHSAFDPAEYEILLSRLSEQDGGGFFARIPALSGCVGDGETELEAIEDVRKAAVEWMATAVAFNEPIPSPRKASDS